MNNKITNWLLCKLDKRKSVKLFSDPVIPRSDALLDGGAIQVGVTEKSRATVTDAENYLVDSVSLVEVSDMIAIAGKMLKDYLNAPVCRVEGDAGFSGIAAGKRKDSDTNDTN